MKNIASFGGDFNTVSSIPRGTGFDLPLMLGWVSTEIMTVVGGSSLVPISPTRLYAKFSGSVMEMDFAVDQMPVRVVTPAKPASATPVVSPSTAELLLARKPVRALPSKQRASKPVEVWISDLYEKDGRLSIRYAVRNQSSQPYFLDTPVVYELDGVHSPESLYGLANSQLGDEQAAKLKAKRQTPVKVLDGQMRPAQVAPGEEAVGVVTLQLASTTHPTVLRLQFPLPKQSETELSDAGQPQVDAFLVR